MRTHALGLPRIVKFGLVGASCLGIQLLILWMLEPFLLAVIANAIGFTVSAQINFVLSRYFTWGDVARRGTRQLVYCWVSFNANVTFAVLVNGTIFWAAHYAVDLPSMVAATLATAVSTTSTFLINHFLVFQTQRGIIADGTSTEHELGVLHASAQRGE